MLYTYCRSETGQDKQLILVRFSVFVIVDKINL